MLAPLAAPDSGMFTLLGSREGEMGEMGKERDVPGVVPSEEQGTGST